MAENSELHITVPIIEPTNLTTDTKPAPTSEETEEFNYQLVYSRYYEECSNLFNKAFSLNGPWTLMARKRIICFIKAKSLVLMDLIFELQPDVLTKYQIVMEDDVEKLVLTGTAIEVLPFEESFDIFVELHKKTNHGSDRQIVMLLANKFVVNEDCLKVFLSLCNVCKKFSLQKKNTKLFNVCVTTEILRCPVYDDSCRYVLFYIDKGTNFTLFRPLITMDEYELSLEILKIFADFGPPLLIETTQAPLFNSVLTLLERGGFRYDIAIKETNEVIGRSYYFMENLVKRRDTQSSNWATTCRFVQYQHNIGALSCEPMVRLNSRHTTPLYKVFYTKYNITEPIIKMKKKLAPSATPVYCLIPSTKSDETNEAPNNKEINVKSPNTDTEKKLVENIKGNIDPMMDGLQSSSCQTTEDLECLRREELKIEYNPIIPETKTVGEHQQSNEKNEIHLLSQVGRNEESTSETHNEGATIEEDISDSETTMIPCSTENELKMEISIENEGLNEEAELGSSKEKRYICSSCNGKMLTDYICFRCQKPTHIFCLTRIGKKEDNNITSFTYCKDCLVLVSEDKSMAVD